MIQELHQKIISQEITIAGLVAEYVARARADTLNCFREIFDEEDIASQVARAEKLRQEGKATPLTGLPIAIKDNILFSGHHAGAGSKMLERYVASYDATVVRALREAGAVIIGRTNMDEFAMGSSTENSAYGVTKNPIDPTRVAGGSSGGSAAAVAAGYVVAALGTETGGSVRQPAALCGLVGLYPSYGTVSRHGVIALGSSLDVVSPFGNTVEDVALLYGVIAVPEPLDSTSVARSKNIGALKKRLAIPKGIFNNGGCDQQVEENFKEMVEKLKHEGYAVDEIELPHFSDALAVYYIIQPAEASSNLARFDGVRYGERADQETISDLYTKTRGALFGKEARRRILLGTYVLSHGYYDAYYQKAVALRAVIRQELEKAFVVYDAIITPTTPTPAFKIGEKANDPVAMYLSDLFTVPANIAHVPALSIPSGATREGLPIGFQCIGPRFGEEILFSLGKEVARLR